MAGRYDIVVDRGATLYRTFTVTEEGTGTPVSYVGYTGRMQVRKDHSASTVVLEASTSNGRMTITGATGMVLLVIPADLTEALTPGTYFYDIMLRDTAGVSAKFLEGTFVVRPTVTRAA